MAQIPNLDNAPLNLRSLREHSQKELVNILKNIRGKKCLVIDQKLSGSLSVIIQTSLLKEHGVELRHLSAEPIQADSTKVVYLVRSQLSLMKYISSHVNTDISKGLQREYYVYFVPRRAVGCEKILEEENIHRLLTIGEYPLYIVPLDEDVLSFELDLAYKECQVEGDTNSLWHIAKAIHKLERNQLTHLRLNLRKEHGFEVAGCKVNLGLLYELAVDMVTPMCSQLTYEGLLDESIGARLDITLVKVNNTFYASIMGLWNLIHLSWVSNKRGEKIKVPLNSSMIADSLTKSNIHEAGLHRYDNNLLFERIQTQTVSELKDFVKKLNSLPEMTACRHINLAQHLSTFTSKPSFLAQLDMEHTIVEAQSYDMRELLHSYGFEHMGTLNNLEKAGLLKKQETKSNWLTVKRALQLVVEDTDTVNPNDISYVFSGYAPLSIRLVQHAIRSGCSGRFAIALFARRPIEEILKLLPGPHSDLKRGRFSSSPSFDTLLGSSASIDNKSVQGSGWKALPSTCCLHWRCNIYRDFCSLISLCSAGRSRKMKHVADLWLMLDSTS
ncbi:hypothetical protein FEM48_Zijuj03G0095300 [Ziziphus jujuba var. spinosa]|uniref:Vacuolar protein-sorting-associated protein 33 homolog n=1 Tax=Ziziphus jujuba var. spinosa TaxID=714518 RepID=A0A978VPI6_ZIZJJ|nr:hypothetical protein FEM48_Zijuj03G0095300 [Ziziphus jujuba var. spinosa]